MYGHLRCLKNLLDGIVKMTITNHILAGAIIGLTITNPVAAVALAFLSHFVMDALPHFGYAGKKGYEEVLKHRLSYVVAIITLVTALVVLGLLVLNGKWYAVAIALVATLPDAMGLYNWLRNEKHGKSAPGIVKLLHIKFHRAIQWYERPWGILVEGAVFVVLSWTLIRLLGF